MPPPSVWGPLLWKVVHGMCGTPIRLNSLQKDSDRELLWIVNHLEYIIPCKECIDHLVSFRRKNPILKSYTTIGEWTCGLHNSVNEKLGKDNHSYSPSELQIHTVKENWAAYLDSVKDSILLGLILGDKHREFTRHMLLWIQYSG